MSSLFPYFTPKLHPVVFEHSAPTCRLGFLLLFWKVLFCLYQLTLSRYLLSLPSFANIVYTCLLFCFRLFILPYYSVYSTFLNIFTCCRSFFTCPSTQTSYSGFCVGWLFGFYGISTFVVYLTPNPFLYT